MTIKPTTALPVYEFDADKTGVRYAFNDLKSGFSSPHLLLSLIQTDFIGRYGSISFSGFWIALSSAATITGLGLLYGQLFGADFSTFFPYVAVGITVWSLISSAVNDGCAVFINGSSIISQTALPMTLIVLKTLGRLLLMMVFRIAVLIVVFVIVGYVPNLTSVVISMAGLLLIVWLAFWFSLAFATLALAYRSIKPLIHTFMSFLFFLTPIFWQPSRLGQYEYVVEFNPFYHLLNIVRGPLLDLSGVPLSFAVSIVLSLTIMLASLVIFALSARRLRYWL